MRSLTAAGSPHRQAKGLIERLQGEGGTVRLESPDDETRALYRRIIHAAKQHGLVPAGFHLRHTGRATGDLIIRLSDDSTPDDTDWNRIRLNTRRVTSDPLLVSAALEKDPSGLDVTAASVPRALSLIRSLAEEARRRGYRLGVNTKTVRPKLFLQVGSARRTVTLHEEYDEIPHVQTDQERRELRRRPWWRPPETDKVPSGRLRLEIARAGWNQRDSWKDDKRGQLEKRLPKILRDVGAGAAADEAARLEAKRAHEAFLAKLQQEVEEEERRRWRAALDEAHPKAVEALRRRAFRSACDAWVAACEIRAFCDALERGAPAEHDHEAPSGAATWVAWGRSAADRIDPTRGDHALGDIAFDITPNSDDLRPFLGDWSPHEPRREYRFERDQDRINAARQQADTWHHGMRGSPSWWRNQ